MKVAMANFQLFAEMRALCWRRSPFLTALCYLTLFLDVLGATMAGLGLRAVVSGSMRDSPNEIWLGAAAAGAGYTVSLVIGELGSTLRILVGSRVAYEQVEYRGWRAAMEIETIDHLERGDYLDRLVQLHGNAQSYPLVSSAWIAVDVIAVGLRLALILILLGTVNPVLLIVIAAAGLPLLLGQRGRAAVRRARIAAAEQDRLQRHLFTLLTRAGSGKEIRVSGVGEELVRRQRAAADAFSTGQVSVRFRAMAGEALGWAVFSLCFVGGLALVVHGRSSGTGIADIVLTVTVGLQLRAAIEAIAARSAQVAGNGEVIEAYRWLREYDRAQRRHTGDGPVPARLSTGIRFEDVSFAYPGTDRPAVGGLSFSLPAASVIALVGGYGSGKTTVIKLLTKMYRPDGGRVLVDGTDLAGFDTSAWRSRLSAVFQDFGRFQVPLEESVAIGERSARGSRGRVVAAMRAADAEHLVDRLAEGITTPLGREFGGAELSEGQWQKVALARASMRTDPLLLVLDEPTASLDAPSEHAVFERYMARARRLARRTGAITIIVSHRFSTVSGANLVLVMDDGRIVESGTHAELMARGGKYADAYKLQAGAYTTHGRPTVMKTASGSNHRL